MTMTMTMVMMVMLLLLGQSEEEVFPLDFLELMVNLQKNLKVKMM